MLNKIETPFDQKSKSKSNSIFSSLLEITKAKPPKSCSS